MAVDPLGHEKCLALARDRGQRHRFHLSFYHMTLTLWGIDEAPSDTLARTTLPV